MSVRVLHTWRLPLAPGDRLDIFSGAARVLRPGDRAVVWHAGAPVAVRVTVSGPDGSLGLIVPRRRRDHPCVGCGARRHHRRNPCHFGAAIRAARAAA